MQGGMARGERREEVVNRLFFFLWIPLEFLSLPRPYQAFLAAASNDVGEISSCETRVVLFSDIHQDASG